MAQTCRKFNACSGVTMVEYGILIGLCTLIAIPSLGMMINSFSNSYNSLETSLSESVTNNLLSGVQSSNSNSGSSNQSATNNSSGSSSGNFQHPALTNWGSPGSINAQFDPSTNQVSFNVFDQSGAGTTATSVEGTRLLSRHLEYLAENATTSDGSPISFTVKNKLLDLAHQGLNLADGEEFFVDNPTDPIAGNLVSDEFLNFHHNYQQILSTLNTMGSEYQSLTEEIGYVSGMIGSIATENILPPAIQANGGSITVINSSSQTVHLTETSLNSYQIGIPIPPGGINLSLSPYVVNLFPYIITTNPFV